MGSSNLAMLYDLMDAPGDAVLDEMLALSELETRNAGASGIGYYEELAQGYAAFNKKAARMSSRNAALLAGELPSAFSREAGVIGAAAIAGSVFYDKRGRRIKQSSLNTRRVLNVAFSPLKGFNLASIEADIEGRTSRIRRMLLAKLESGNGQVNAFNRNITKRNLDDTLKTLKGDMFANTMRDLASKQKLDPELLASVERRADVLGALHYDGGNVELTEEMRQEIRSDFTRWGGRAESPKGSSTSGGDMRQLAKEVGDNIDGINKGLIRLKEKLDWTVPSKPGEVKPPKEP